MKRFIAILLAAVVAVTLALPAFAAGAQKPAAGAKPVAVKNSAKTTKNNTLKVLAISDAHFLAR